MQLTEILKILMQHHAINGHELSRYTNIPQQTIHRLIVGTTEDPKLSTLLPIAKKFNLSLGQLIGEEPLPTIYQPHPSQAGYPVPLVSYNNSATWSESIQFLYPNNWPYWIYIEKKPSDRTFALKIIHDNIFFPKGSILIVDLESTLISGDLILVNLTDFYNPVIRKVCLKNEKFYIEHIQEGVLQEYQPENQKILGKIIDSKKANNHPEILHKKKNIFIAAVSDGKKTILKIQNEKGEDLGAGEANSANLCHSVGQAWQSINQALKHGMIQAKIKVNDPEYHLHAALGLKSVEMAERLKEFRKHEHPFTTLLVDSDAYFGCLGAHNLQDGIILIVDEGVSGFQIAQGECRKFGGWGFPHRDEGCAAWIGMQAVRHMFWWKDGDIETSELLQKIFLYFRNRTTNVVEWAMSARPDEYAELASMVIDFSNLGDPYAKNILTEAYNEIKRFALAVDKNSSDKTLPIAMIGEYAWLFENKIPKELQNRLVKPKFNGVDGALKLLKINFSF